MLILKLGGAGITDKTSPNTPQLDVIDAIAQALAKHPQPMIVVHGAGSFGHIIAQAHQLHLGYQSESQRAALVQLQLQLHDLNRYVVDALIKAGLPAMTIHPASMCVLDAGRIADFFLEPIQQMLALGMVPVLYGDCVWDRAQTFSIISGDQLVIYLANQLQADRVAFATNVDGVLDSSGQVIPKINANTQIAARKQAGADVTGGMLGKLSEIATLQNPDARTWIFNIHNQHHLERVLTHQDGAGTLIITSKE